MPLKQRDLPQSVPDASQASKPRKLKWYESDSPSIIIALLVILPPLGLWSMWRYSQWPLEKKKKLTGVSIAILLIAQVVSPTIRPRTSRSVAVVSASAPRTFLGRSKTGYELWAGDGCVYVKGITESDLARLNTDVWGYKEAVKQETGYKCVFFE